MRWKKEVEEVEVVGTREAGVALKPARGDFTRHVIVSERSRHDKRIPTAFH